MRKTKQRVSRFLEPLIHIFEVSETYYYFVKKIVEHREFFAIFISFKKVEIKKLEKPLKI